MRNPLVEHVIVKMVQRANKIAANPYQRAGLPLEDATVYRLTVERHLAKLSEGRRLAITYMAEGYALGAAAKRAGISREELVRTLERYEE